MCWTARQECSAKHAVRIDKVRKHWVNFCVRSWGALAVDARNDIVDVCEDRRAGLCEMFGGDCGKVYEGVDENFCVVFGEKNNAVCVARIRLFYIRIHGLDVLCNKCDGDVGELDI